MPAEPSPPSTPEFIRVSLMRNPAVLSEETDIPSWPLVVAVTGHREIRTEEVGELEAQVRTILRHLADTWRAAAGRGKNASHASIIVMSGLAEGADQLVARVALEKGIDAQLAAVLPMSLDLYEKDFGSPEALAQFHALWNRAAYRGEVPIAPADRAAVAQLGSPQRDRQYEKMGVCLVQHSYVMIALWDGVERDRAGGTSQVVQFKLRGCANWVAGATGLPGTVGPGRSQPIATVGPVYQVVTPRTGEMRPVDAYEIKIHLREDGLVPGKILASPRDDKTTHEVIRQLQTCNKDMKRMAAPLAKRVEIVAEALLPEAIATSEIRPLRRAFALADSLAIYYKKRTTVILGFYFVLVVLAGFASAYAGCAGYFKGPQCPVSAWITIAPYALACLGIYFVYVVSARQQYHNRHMDYRALAEGLRVQVYWRLAGIPNCVADHYLQNQTSGLDWIRAGLRTIDMQHPPGAVPEMETAVGLVRTRWVRDQIGFFKERVREAHRVLTLLSPAGTLMVNVAIAWGGVKVFMPQMQAAVLNWLGGDRSAILHILFIVLLIGLSSAGTLAVAFLGYSHFRGLSEQTRRYTKMAFLYSVGQRNLDRFGPKLSPEQCQQVGREIFDLGRDSLSENADWLIMQRQRKLDLPR